jgi:hypothetical protein
LDGMISLAKLDRMILPARKLIARVTAPDPSRLPHPTFSARIADRVRRWQTLREPNPYLAVASKVDGQAFMRSLGHAVPEVYGVYPSIDAIPRLEDLPETFVLKPTHGWSAAGVFLMDRGFDLIRKRRFTQDELIRTAKSFRGFGAESLKGSWVAEELLFGFDGRRKPSLDYKIFCFGSQVPLIQINMRSGVNRPRSCYWLRDADWRPVPCRVSWDKYPQPSALTRPPCLDEMLKVVSDAAGRLNIFIRIDMYATERGPVFGEFTAYPHFGKDYTPRGDAWLGSYWKTLDGGA